MGYIGVIKSINRKKKLINISGQRFEYSNVAPWVDGPKKFLKAGDKVSYSYAGASVTWIGKATPHYIRVAKELKERYGKKKNIKARKSKIAIRKKKRKRA